METAEQNYLDARKAARAQTDSQEQPEDVQEVDVLNQPIEDEEGANDVETTSEIEESEEEVEETQDAEGDLLYYDIDGEEVSLDQIKEWKDNGLMQSDYTRKTQELAQSRKEFEAQREQFNELQSKLSEQTAMLDAMISEDSLTDEQIAEMREYEPERYIEHIEKQAKRKELLKEVKKNVKPQVNVQEEQAKLIKANPDWIKDGKATESYQKDMKALSDYYTENGFTQEQVNDINSNALLAQAVIDAARYKTINTKKAIVEKRVRKAPVSTKPKSQATNAMTEKMKSLRAKAQQGDAKAFAQLRQLQRELKGN